MRHDLIFSFILVLFAGCAESPKPVSAYNPYVAQLEADGWVSQDTLIAVDPQTFEERIQVTRRDMSPDTLSNGSIVYKLTQHIPTLKSCELDEDPALCTQQALQRYVSENLEYPRWAQVQGFEGTAIATFVIGPDGRVRDMGVKRSMGDQIDKLVLQLIERMPQWNPGFHDGQPVAVYYELPVTFSLPKDE